MTTGIFQLKSHNLAVCKEGNSGDWRLRFGLLCMILVAGIAGQDVRAQGTARGQVLKPTVAVQTNGEAAAAIRRLSIADDVLEQTQRVFKFYLQILLDVEVDKSRTRKSEAISLVSSNIDKLRKEKLSPVEVSLLTEIDTVWSGMLRSLSSDPNPDALARLIPLNDRLLDNSEKLTQLMSKELKSGDLTHLIGHQEMLIQRIARNYYLYHAGYKTPEVRGSVQSLLERFVAVEEQLYEFGSNAPQFKSNVELVQIQVIFLKNAVQSMEKAGKPEWVTMSKLSDRLREVLHTLRVAAEKAN